jgi:hypothetical protein
MDDMRSFEARPSFNPSTALIAAKVLSPRTRDELLTGGFLRFETIWNFYREIGLQATRKMATVAQ